MTTAAINQTTVIARESAPGTPGTEWWQLTASSADLQRQATFDQHRPDGIRFPTVINENTEMSKVVVKGKTDYNDLFIWFAGGLCEPTTIQVPTTTLAWQHDFLPVSDGPNDRYTYTIRVGDSTYAEEANNLNVSQVGIKLARTGGQDLAAGLIGNAVEDSVNDAIAMPVSFTAVPQAPAISIHWAMKLADTQAALDAAALIDDAFNMEWMLDAIVEAMFAYNRSVSPKDYLESEPKGTAKFKRPVNASTLALRAILRNGATKWMRLEAIGPIIEGSTNYRIVIDTALKVNEAPAKGPEQGALSLDWGLGWTHAGLEGFATKIQLINSWEGMAVS